MVTITIQIEKRERLQVLQKRREECVQQMHLVVNLLRDQQEVLLLDQQVDHQNLVRVLDRLQGPLLQNQAALALHRQERAIREAEDKKQNDSIHLQK